MMFVLGLARSVLLADFLSGLAHWLEDAYFSPSTPGLGRTIQKNILHHQQPQAFVVYPWHVTIRSSLVSALLVAAALATVGVLGPVWAGALLLAVFANQVHKWSHANPGEVPRMIGYLQAIHVLQTSKHHLRHHRGSKNTHYCVITNVLNPVLDHVRLWYWLERGIQAVTGVSRRVDESIVAPDYRLRASAGRQALGGS